MTIKKFSKLVAALCMTLCVSTTTRAGNDQPPDADTLINKSIEAAGGKEAMLAIKSMSLKGTISMPAQKISGTVEVLRKADKSLLLAEIPGIGQIRSGIDGDIAYEHSDIMGSRLLSDDEKEKLLDGMDPQSQINHFNDLKDKTVIGPEQVGDNMAWVLSGITKKNDKETHWIDTKTFLTLKSDMSITVQMGKMRGVSEMSDYKTVDKITMPMTIKQTVGPASVVLEFTEVKINPEIDDAKFTLPDEVKKLVEQAKAAKTSTSQPATQAAP